MRTDWRFLLVFVLALLVAACPQARPTPPMSKSTLRLVFETSQATRLSVNRAGLSPRTAHTLKSIDWRAENATIDAQGNIKAEGEFTLQATMPVTPGVEYALRATSNVALTVEVKMTGDEETFEEALINPRADGFEYILSTLADGNHFDVRVKGKGNARFSRFDLRESLLREPVELLSAEDAAIRGIVTHGRGGSDLRERESLLAVGDSDYEWPLPPPSEPRALELETGVVARHGDDPAKVQPLMAFVELRENGVWREAYKIERGGAADDRGWRRATLPLGNADAIRLATRKRSNDPSVTLAWARAVVHPIARPPRLPDVVLISIDALRADRLGAYGSKLGLSPELDKLASGAVVFEEARTARGQTWESLTAIAYGTWPDEVGVARRGDRTAHGSMAVVDVFARHGYFTARLGNALVMPGQLGTFDVSEDAHRDEVGFGRLKTLLEEERDRPKFIWLHVAVTHYPFYLRKGSLPPGAPLKLDVPWFYKVVHDGGPPEAIAAISARADVAVRETDTAIGELLPGLQDPNRPGGPAIVAITADHGSHRGEDGIWFMHGTYHRCVLRVPFLLSWPGHLDPRRVSPLVRTIDYGPTLLDLAGLPHGMFLGESLVPLAHGEPMAPLMNTIRDSSTIAVIENDRYKAVGAVNANKSWKQADMKFQVPDISLFRWRTDLEEVHNVADEEPIVAAELLSRFFRSGEQQEQKLSPEAIRLLKQAGYATEDH